MKLIRVGVVFAGLVVANATLAGTSSAISPVGCQSGLAQLRSDTWAFKGSFTNPADFADSYAKINIAWPRITGGIAPPDTFQILSDYQTQLNALAAASPPQVDPAVAQRLVSGAQDVLDCLRVNNP
ncbi:MAG TPA: hypothetical protein VFB19_16610 [Mycobacterium sp.]|nr:hypothetical protein [Mycobacterium sp.]